MSCAFFRPSLVRRPLRGDDRGTEIHFGMICCDATVRKSRGAEGSQRHLKRRGR